MARGWRAAFGAWQGGLTGGWPVCMLGGTGTESEPVVAEGSGWGLGTKTCDMGLWVLPYHETVYKLEGSGVKAFSAEAGINAIVAKQAAGHRAIRVCFEVHVDGRVAAHSGLMKSADGPRLLVVEGLEKAEELKLVTRLHEMLYGDGTYRGEFAYSNWADPTLYK